MKIKIKLSIMMIAIVLVVAGGLAVIELVRASNITLNLSKQKTMYLARQRAQYWDGRMSGYINILQTLSNNFNFYENIPVATRREMYGNTLQSVFEDVPDFLRIFTIWKPNAIDGNDARNIGRVGSTPTGQFAYVLSREDGDIKIINATMVTDIMEHMTGANKMTVFMSDITPFKNMGKDTYCVRVQVPIINKRINDVVGVVGCQLDIAMCQPRIEQTI
ncbi:PDC sensor domain-containing protein, partial [Treponema sp. R6D11]